MEAGEVELVPRQHCPLVDHHHPLPLPPVHRQRPRGEGEKHEEVGGVEAVVGEEEQLIARGVFL